jgi:tetratricopeptide (TPR) repeat protein
VPVIRQMVGKKPDDWDFKQLLVETLMRSAESNNVAGTLDELSRSMPLSATNAVRFATLWMQAGLLSNAISLFEQGLDKEPRQHAWRLALAAAQLQTKQPAAALSNLYLIDAAQPDNQSVQELLAGALNELGRHTEAMDRYRRVIRLNQNNALAMNNLAYLLLQRNENISEAFELAQTAVQLAPESYALDTLGYAYYKRGKYDAALRYLKQAEDALDEEDKPRDAEMEYHFGIVYAARGDTNRAVTCLTRALAAKPELSAALKSEPCYGALKTILNNTWSK